MLTLKRFIQRFPGSSLPAEVEATDGRRLVLKMKGAGNGTQSLLAEFVANRAAASLGWPVPQPEPMMIPDQFPWGFGTDEFDDIVQKSYGVNMALQNLGPCEALPAAKMLVLPENFLLRMASLDAFFMNYDRLPASRNVLRDAQGKDWLIDHGSCLFVDAELSRKPLALAPGHLLGPGGMNLVDRGLCKQLAQAARAAVKELPRPWLAELGWEEGSLMQRLNEREAVLR
jgi:hypothetical protein